MRVLIVEDEEKIVAFMKAGLRIENFEVEVAYEGEEALSILEKDRFDIVLLDLMMPNLDGFETCVRIRERDRSLPIIMISARDAQAVADKAFALGVDDYIVKPFSLNELIAKIKNYQNF